MALAYPSAQLNLPGLFPLSRQQAGHVPLFSRFLSRAEQQSVNQNTSLAAFRYFHDYATLPQADSWCCDPVYLHADATQAIIFAFPEDEINSKEADELVAALNEHFAEQGLRIEFKEPGHWYLHGLTADLVNQTGPAPLSQVVGCNMQPLLQQTTMAGLNSLLTEIQMLLYQHPVNQQREAEGRLPINGVWIYGAGLPPSKEDLGWEYVISDSAVYKGIAAYKGIPCEPFMAATLQCYRFRQRTLLQSDELLTLRTQSQEQWLARLQNIETEIFKPLWKALKRGAIKSLTLSDGSATQYQLNRWQVFHFWRRNWRFSDAGVN